MKSTVGQVKSFEIVTQLSSREFDLLVLMLRNIRADMPITADQRDLAEAWLLTMEIPPVVR